MKLINQTTLIASAVFVANLLAPVSHAANIYTNNFNSGVLGSEWSTPYASVPGRGVVEVRPQPDFTGSNALSMQIKGGGSAVDNLNEIELVLDLSNYTDVELTFDHYVYHDIPSSHSGLIPFLGHSDFDGISISSDRTNWFPIWTPTSVTTSPGIGVWVTGESLDLSSFINYFNSTHLALGSSFIIRFQQYGSFSPNNMDSDGRAFDNISITGNSVAPVPEPTTLALLGIGAVCSVLTSSRRRRLVK